MPFPCRRPERAARSRSTVRDSGPRPGPVTTLRTRWHVLARLPTRRAHGTGNPKQGQNCSCDKHQGKQQTVLLQNTHHPILKSRNGVCTPIAFSRDKINMPLTRFLFRMGEPYFPSKQRLKTHPQISLLQSMMLPSYTLTFLILPPSLSNSKSFPDKGFILLQE